MVFILSTLGLWRLHCETLRQHNVKRVCPPPGRQYISMCTSMSCKPDPTNTDRRDILYYPQEHLYSSVLWCFCLPAPMHCTSISGPFYFIFWFPDQRITNYSHRTFLLRPRSKDIFQLSPSTQALWPAPWIHGCEGWCWVVSQEIQNLSRLCFLFFLSLLFWEI